MRLALAALSAVLVSIGAGLVYLPAGLIVAGLIGFGALYVTTYLEARRNEAARRPR